MASAPPTTDAPSGRAARRAARRARRRARRSIFWRWRRAFYLLLLLGIAGITGVGLVLSRIELPQADRPIESSFICDAGVAVGDCGPDTALAKLSSEEDRVLVTYEQLPQVLIDAVVATEDRDFFEHDGIDPVGIGRALWADIRNVGVRQGGSTITQQLVKNVYLDPERTLLRKVREAVLAVKLERDLEKEEILERYLNEIYLGRGAYGVEAAARTYFGVGVEQLELWQAAYLAGLIRAPETADAWRHPEEATRRRDTVLRAMVEEGYIDQAEADGASAVPWVTDAVDPATGQLLQVFNVLPRVPRDALGSVERAELGTAYVVDWVRQEVDRLLGEQGASYTRGLRVYTTLDLGLQEAAYEALYGTLDQPDDPAAALVALDDAGRVRAIVAGRDVAASQVNLALGAAGGGSGRQAGSSFKPLVLAEFLRQGNSIRSTYDSPGKLTLEDANGGEDWVVRNYGEAEQGTLTVERATWRSSNTVYAQMMLDVGVESAWGLARDMGITSPNLPKVPSLVLGAGEVSVLDMATAYSVFANRGQLVEPHIVERIEDSEGRVLWDSATEVGRREVLPQEVADTVTATLTGVIERGTGEAAQLAVPAAGKTGTTQNNQDAWFVGYTCRVTAAVWMGYEQPRAMESVRGREVTGGSFPAEMWQRFMSRATEGQEPCDEVEGFDGGLVREGDEEGEEGDGDAEADEGESTTTTAPPETTTTAPPETTTTTAPPPTTTTAPPPPPTTTTTAPPPPTTTTTAPGGGGP